MSNKCVYCCYWMLNLFFIFLRISAVLFFNIFWCLCCGIFQHTSRNIPFLITMIYNKNEQKKRKSSTMKGNRSTHKAKAKHVDIISIFCVFFNVFPLRWSFMEAYNKNVYWILGTYYRVWLWIVFYDHHQEKLKKKHTIQGCNAGCCVGNLDTEQRNWL